MQFITALTVPDIAGAVESPGTTGSKKRYADWIDNWFIRSFPSYSQHQIDGLAMYSLEMQAATRGSEFACRCACSCWVSCCFAQTLDRFQRGRKLRHASLCSTADRQGDSWTVYTQEFCREMIVTAQTWMASKAGDAVALERLRALVDVRTSVPPISEGVPLICAAIEAKS